MLPIAMTLVNICSAYIYTKGCSLREKLQPVLLALLFLAVLYHSPSGLVLYWTLNNIFSLVKNLVVKTVKYPKCFLAAAIGALDIIYVIRLIYGGIIRECAARGDNEALLFYAIIALLLLAPCMSYIYTAKNGTRMIKAAPGASSSVSWKEVIVPEMALTILIGLMVPVTVISSAPLDFVDPIYYYNPMNYIVFSFTVAIGMFMVWGNVLAGMLTTGGKRIFGLVLLGAYVGSLLDYFFFRADVGVLSMTLQFERLPHFGRDNRIWNIVLLTLCFGSCVLFWKKRNMHRLCLNIVFVTILAMVVLAGKQWIRAEQVINRYENTEKADERIEIKLSRNGKNVIVIMLDRAIGGILPYSFDEKKELYEMYEGFVFYPNTASTGLHTNYGAPALFGGYEYTTGAMNRRDDVLLAQKHDEALLVMPVIFGEAGYQVRVADPPYAGYQEISDLSIYRDYPYIHPFYYEAVFQESSTPQERIGLTERNLLFYCLYRCAPGILQARVYDGGAYLSASEGGFTSQQNMFRSYGALKSLKEITVIEEAGDNLFMMDNNLPHQPYLPFQLPDYSLPHSVDNTGYEDHFLNRTLDGKIMDIESNDYNLYTYHCNTAALLRLGEWFEYLKQEGIYDNTRIIIAADHGMELGMFSYMELKGGVGQDIDIDAEGVNALLMYKDFDSNGPFSIDGSFMTNADVPSLAVRGIIGHPTNPFTGHVIDMSGKKDGIEILWAHNTDILINNGYVFEPKEGPWYHVKDDIFDVNNWQRIK